MDDVASAPPPPTSQNHLLRRRNSISTPVVVPINVTVLPHQSSSPSTSVATTTSSSSTSSSSSSSGDFDLISVKPASYISLKDLLPPTPVNSPKPNSPANTGSEISIKNRLVKQAAWAYLQPMSTSPDSSARKFIHRLRNRLQLLDTPFAAFRRFFHLHIFRRLNHAFDWLLRAVRIRTFG